MDSAKISDWMQVVGIFAVVLSLIFVGLQMRQAQDIALSQTYQSRAIASSEFMSSLAGNSTLVGIFEKAAAGGLDQLTTEEEAAARYLVGGVYYLYDNTHFQYMNGFVSENLWKTIRRNMKGQMRHPLWRKMMLERQERMRPSFRELVVDVVDELDAELSE